MDVAEILKVFQDATPMMIAALALAVSGFVVWAALKIINLLGNHLIHAVGAVDATLGAVHTELIALNAHEVVEAQELRKQTDTLGDIKAAVGSADTAARTHP